MTTTTTSTTPSGWSPDQTAFVPGEVIPDALVLQASTVVGQIEGDAPAVRVPWVADDGTAGFVDEGATIPEGAQEFTETVVRTGKVATLGKFSREQLAQPNAATLIVNSMQRSVVSKANSAFLGNASDPTGLLNVTDIVDGGSLGTDLDTLAGAIAAIEGDGGKATHLLAAPGAWATLSTLTTGTGSTVPLLGAATDAPTRQVLGVPVTVTPAMPADTILLLDSTSVVSAVGSVNVARSEDAYFDSDVIGVRVTFRLGWSAMRPERLVKISTTTEP